MALLTPFREQITEFKQRVEQVYHTESKDRASLLTEVRNLHRASDKINQEAENLAKALKGDKRLQGNWGELVLERVLDESGLAQGSRVHAAGDPSHRRRRREASRRHHSSTRRQGHHRRLEGVARRIRARRRGGRRRGCARASCVNTSATCARRSNALPNRNTTGCRACAHSTSCCCSCRSSRPSCWRWNTTRDCSPRRSTSASSSSARRRC